MEQQKQRVVRYGALLQDLPQDIAYRQIGVNTQGAQLHHQSVMVQRLTILLPMVGEVNTL